MIVSCLLARGADTRAIEGKSACWRNKLLLQYLETMKTSTLGQTWLILQQTTNFINDTPILQSYRIISVLAITLMYYGKI